MKTHLCSGLAASGLILLGACTPHETAREIDWAKAALARNPAFEIVATDESAGVFTVRDTATGTMQTLRLEDLIAAPAVVPTKPEVAAATPPAPVDAPELPDDTVPPLASAQTTAPVEIERSESSNALAEGPGYSIARSESTAPPEPSAAEENVERRSDPIICQGNRLMRIDGETIEFTGDAVIAEKGCDLYISNARISAGGVGIIARQARVHIVNSTIGGTRGSYEVSEGAQLYVARSTFSGVGRRFDSATMNDLGGNAYKSVN